MRPKKKMHLSNTVLNIVLTTKNQGKRMGMRLKITSILLVICLKNGGETSRNKGKNHD